MNLHLDLASSKSPSGMGQWDTNVWALTHLDIGNMVGGLVCFHDITRNN